MSETSSQHSANETRRNSNKENGNGRTAPLYKVKAQKVGVEYLNHEIHETHDNP